MATNTYFNNYTYGRHQSLQDDLLIEAIKQFGIDLKYMPRTVFNQDMLLGEDPLSRFSTAVDIEMYVKNTTSFDGDQEFLGKFGLELRDSITLVLAKKRWEQITNERLMDEIGYNYQLQTANTAAYGNSHSILLEAGSANGYSITSPRPMEGDLIYFHPSSSIFEIKFVGVEDPFYPHGKRHLYTLKCEQFRYSSEQLRTGNTTIDAAETSHSLDLQLFQYLTEDGDNLQDEESTSYLIQEFRIETQAKIANNEYIMKHAPTFLSFSETNPFGQDDRM